MAGLAVLGDRAGTGGLRGHGQSTVPSGVLRLTDDVYARMVGHCYDGLPLEACGLLGGDPATAKATLCYPTGNVAASARVYTVEPWTTCGPTGTPRGGASS